jgi:hypothetical protein
LLDANFRHQRSRAQRSTRSIFIEFLQDFGEGSHSKAPYCDQRFSTKRTSLRSWRLDQKTPPEKSKIRKTQVDTEKELLFGKETVRMQKDRSLEIAAASYIARRVDKRLVFHNKTFPLASIAQSHSHTRNIINQQSTAHHFNYNEPSHVESTSVTGDSTDSMVISMCLAR